MFPMVYWGGQLFSKEVGGPDPPVPPKYPAMSQSSDPHKLKYDV